MMANGDSRSSIASKLKMREETISRWRKIPEFMQEYERLINETRNGFKNRLTILVAKSIDEINKGINNSFYDDKRLKTALNVIKSLEKSTEPTNNDHILNQNILKSIVSPQLAHQHR